MLVYFLVFAFGWTSKISVDEADKYMTTADIQRCARFTKSANLSCIDSSRGTAGEVLDVLNSQPDFWENLIEKKGQQ